MPSGFVVGVMVEAGKIRPSRPKIMTQEFLQAQLLINLDATKFSNNLCNAQALWKFPCFTVLSSAVSRF